jgi:hypothetical protein
MRSPLVNRGLCQGVADTWATVLLRYRPNGMTGPVGVAKIGD